MDLKAKAAQLAGQKQEVASQLIELEADQGELQGQAQALQGQLDALQSQASQLHASIGALHQREVRPLLRRHPPEPCLLRRGGLPGSRSAGPGLAWHASSGRSAPGNGPWRRVT